MTNEANAMIRSVVILLLAILLCAGCNSSSITPPPASQQATAALMGFVSIVPDDGAVVMASFPREQAAVWSPASEQLTFFPTPLTGFWQIHLLRDDDRWLIEGSTLSTSPQGDAAINRRLVWLSKADGAVKRQVVIPDGPMLSAWMSRDLVVAGCWKDAQNQDAGIELRVFRMQSDKAEPIASFDPGNIANMVRIDADRLLLRILPASETPIATPETDEAGPKASETAEHADETRQVPSGGELAVFSVPAFDVSDRTPTAVDASSLCVSHNGRWLVVRRSSVVELRSLPKLELVKSCSITDWPLCAVSSDGRYVAGGCAVLWLWDTQTGDYYQLDRLNSALLDARKHLPEMGPNEEVDSNEQSTAYYQYCLTALAFAGTPERLVGVMADGQYLVWDPTTQSRVSEQRIATVEYVGKKLRPHRKSLPKR